MSDAAAQPANRYPDAIWLPADRSNFLALDPKRPAFSLIVIHATDGGPKAENTAAFFAQPKDQRSPPKASSAHFVVGQDGAVVQCVDLGDIAYHASRVNSIACGIEHCARTPQTFGKADPGLPYSAAQLAASARLCAWLCRLAGLPIDRVHIKGHAEAAPWDSHDDCPCGPGLSLDDYVAQAQAAAAALGPLP